MFISEQIRNKWKPMLEHEDLPAIRDTLRRDVTAQMLENTVKNFDRGAPRFLSEDDGQIPTNVTGGISNYDPVLITLVRRALPNLIAYDICGVVPMTGPTGVVFALRARYANQSGDQAFYNEPNTQFSTVASGANTIGEKQVGGYPQGGSVNTYNYAQGMSTAQSEALGSTSNSDFAQMAFTIDKVTVTAQARALKAEYTMEMAQDLKAIHGLDAETELANIMTVELLAEINRQIVRTVNVTALQGCQAGTTTAGQFDLDVDSNGRWSVEKFKGLHFQLERECNAIAKATRRGKGNFIICSSDVATALAMAGVLDYAPAMDTQNLQIDDTGNTFAGVLNKRIKVFIDPYSTGNYITAGYKGGNAMDAGLFYCPYVPLQMVRAVDD